MSREDSPLPAIVVEWGLATAAYQVEGAVAEDGRGKSIWDTFCHLQPTRTKGANGDIACDHYQQYEEDFDLLTRYGAKAYRLSIPRGITPWVTLYHLNRPQALHDRYGGWLDVQESQLDFERYARGYSTGLHAPGRSSTNDQSEAGNSATEPWVVGKAQIMSHIRAVVNYWLTTRTSSPPKPVRSAYHSTATYYEPWDGADAHDEQAAERRMEFHMGWFANPILYVVLPSFVVTFTNYKTLDRTPKKSALMLKQMFTERQGRTVT
ncbi:hypothetical protein ED733_007206 [Metarhizium rileyi]|uniref:Glycoside hydrolase, family 1 n=1 Tax=Metarhizium rileyi (strain RCEF 4871) TaxID=1649241 RepID=A0A5C6GJ66_METRR|nr:hypothetical protein ED733_007206 [Metarhizium rileyi]